MTVNPYECGDGGCVLRVPLEDGRQHTNGGCRCLPLKMTPAERVKLRAGIRWLAEQVAERAAVDALNNNDGSTT